METSDTGQPFNTGYQTPATMETSDTGQPFNSGYQIPATMETSDTGQPFNSGYQTKIPATMETSDTGHLVSLNHMEPAMMEMSIAGEDFGNEYQLTVSNSNYHDGEGVVMQCDTPSDEATATDGLSSGAEVTPTRVCYGWYSRQDWYVLAASVIAALGGLLFGYDTGIISGALLQLESEFGLDCTERELVVSVMMLGALMASLVAGSLVDRFGRKLSIIANAVVFIIGAIILATSINFAMMIVGRLVIGFGVSMSAIAECIYISEISPVGRRGFLVSLNEFSITVGFLLAYLVNYCFINIPHGWRYMFGLGIIPAILQGVGMVFMPKSPRYLLLRNHEYQARNVLLKLRPSEEVDMEMRQIQRTVLKERNMGFRDLCRLKDNMLTRMGIAFGLVIFQQVTGQTNVLYYAPTVFRLLGFRTYSSATLATVALGIVKVIATGIALYNFDKFGRRKLLVGGTTVMLVSILTLGVVTRVWQSSFQVTYPCENILSPNLNHSNGTLTHDIMFHGINNQSTSVSFNGQSKNLLHSDSNDYGGFSLIMKRQVGENNRPNEATYLSTLPNLQITTGLPATTKQGTTGDSPPPQVEISQAAVWVSFSSLLCYVAGYALGFGPGTWLVLSEIFPITVKGRALSSAVVVNWIINLVISLTFLDTMSAVGVSATFLIYAAMCALSIVFILLCVPETKGKSLEEISGDLQKWSVREQIKNMMCCKKSQSDLQVQYQRIGTEMASPINEY